MPLLDSLCRSYQSFFSPSHPDEARLVELHSSGKTDQFLLEYFEHEYEKGKEVVARFSSIAAGWQGGTALDFGCGAGGLTYRIAEVCSEVVGIDVESYKLEFAKSQSLRLNRSNARFLCYDGEDVPLADDSFDVVFCVDVIEHLPTPQRFVSEFYRLLKPGGLLLLTFGPPWCHAHGKHMWAKLPGWWTHLIFPRSVVMRVSGFQQDSTWEQLGLHRLTVAKFSRIMRETSFERLYLDERVKKAVAPLKYIPWVRELFISEVTGVYQKPMTPRS
jgi:ubiquinone/menaquinone biosynthesis C-methylase UbiE